MILPIVLYGDPVLRKNCIEIDRNFAGLSQLVADMYETMYTAKGVGLAGPQVGYSLRLFVIDPSNFEDENNNPAEKEALKKAKRVFINPVILEERGKEKNFTEGCLSIPGIREGVNRKSAIKIQYQDENFNAVTEEFDGLPARIILHEFDHIQGILFVDRINSLRKQLLKRKLNDISKGIVDISYKIKPPYSKSKKTIKQ